MKEKMLSKIEIDRLNNKTGTMQRQIEKLEKEANSDLEGIREDLKNTSKSYKKEITEFPPERPNPYENQEIERFHMRENTTL